MDKRGRAHAFFALARTSPAEDRNRHAGLSQFVVALNSPGVTIRPILLLTGEHHFNEVHLDGVFVPDDMVLGEIGAGWHQVTSEPAFERRDRNASCRPTACSRCWWTSSVAPATSSWVACSPECGLRSMVARGLGALDLEGPALRRALQEAGFMRWTRRTDTSPSASSSVAARPLPGGAAGHRPDGGRGRGPRAAVDAAVEAVPAHRPLAVAAAAVQCARTADFVAARAHQLHGAIGTTFEHGLRRLTTRLWSWPAEWGNETAGARVLADAAFAAGGAGVWAPLTGDYQTVSDSA